MTESSEREFWDQRAEAWVRRADSLDSLSDAYGIPAMDALGIEPGERILEIGCGPGATAIKLADRVGPSGEIVAVDISPAMIAAAIRRATASGVTNVRFEAADAQTGDLGGPFDAAYSRFGVMFFVDPPAAFANIGRALRAGGRFACAVWSPLADNPWMFVPTLAAGPVLGAELSIPGPGEPGPFSLADAEHVRTLLDGAGFVDVTIDPVAGSRLVTDATADDDIRMLFEVGPLGAAFAGADEAQRGAAIDAVRAAIEPFREDGGWRLPGSALKVTARRP